MMVEVSVRVVVAMMMVVMVSGLGMIDMSEYL